jgi:hypothetical protein
MKQCAKERRKKKGTEQRSKARKKTKSAEEKRKRKGVEERKELQKKGVRALPFTFSVQWAKSRPRLRPLKRLF